MSERLILQKIKEADQPVFKPASKEDLAKRKESDPFARNKDQYLQDPNRCPFCESADITGDEIDFGMMSSTLLTREISCNACEEHWTEHFTLTDIIA